MRNIVLTVTLTLSAMMAEQATASDRTDAMAAVHRFVDGFNKGDLKAAIAACADEASVIDDFPPHEWQGAGCEMWADGYTAVAKSELITDAKIVLGKPRHVDVTDDRAYIVVPVTLVLKHKGKPGKLPSLFTAALRKNADGWRITAWAWADL